MKKRTILFCSFALLCANGAFSQSQELSTTKQLTQNTARTRKPIAAPALTVESIDTELKTLNDVLILNENDPSFRKEDVNRRIQELTDRKKQLAK